MLARALWWVRAAAVSLVAPGRVAEIQMRVPCGVGEGLQVHAVVAVFAGVERLVCRHAVDADEGAVQDGVVGAGGGHVSQRGGQAGCAGGQQVHRLADVAVDGGDPDAEPGGEPGVGVAVA
jgi:hypothetical protein